WQRRLKRSRPKPGIAGLLPFAGADTSSLADPLNMGLPVSFRLFRSEGRTEIFLSTVRGACFARPAPAYRHVRSTFTETPSWRFGRRAVKWNGTWRSERRNDGNP